MDSRIVASRRQVIEDLLDYGESEVALEVDVLSEEKWSQLRRLAFDLALRHRLISKALALAAVEVVEGKPRPLRRTRRRFARE